MPGAFALQPTRVAATLRMTSIAFGALILIACNREPGDGWATYSMRNRKAVAMIIGDRTFTISQSLRRDAKATYGIIRGIMRSV